MNPGKKQIKENYDALGPRIYDIRYTDEQNAKFRAIFTQFTLGETSTVFDQGTGTGLLLDQVDSPIVGLDLSGSLLARARDRIRGHPFKFIVQGDAENLPIRESVFQHAFSITVIQNLPDPVRGLRELKRVSRPGSRVVVSVLRKAAGVEQLQGWARDAGWSVESVSDMVDTNDVLAVLSYPN